MRWPYLLFLGAVLALFMVGSLPSITLLDPSGLVGTCVPEEHDGHDEHEERDVEERTQRAPTLEAALPNVEVIRVIVHASRVVTPPRTAPSLHPSQYSVRRLI